MPVFGGGLINGGRLDGFNAALALLNVESTLTEQGLHLFDEELVSHVELVQHHELLHIACYFGWTGRPRLLSRPPQHFVWVEHRLAILLDLAHSIRIGLWGLLPWNLEDGGLLL